MMPRAVLSLVLMVSCAHALVHVYELALPSVELRIAEEFWGQDEASGKRLTGFLSNAWRLMWGLGAIVAGWLVDRCGSRPLLAVYLLGCAGTCAWAATAESQSGLLIAMVAMGALASIYHPAGLALISHETTPDNRPRALGIHGIFGSAGIGLTPLLAGGLLAASFSWRQVYWSLMLPGTVLGLVFVFQSRQREARFDAKSDSRSAADGPEQQADWPSFFLLTVMASGQGFVYSALMSFLPRYLSRSGIGWFGSDQTSGNYLAAGVLLLGCVGQDLAGRFARTGVLERQLTMVTFANVPLLFWMAFAAGWDRALAAGVLALVHFMHQPLYNTLIAKYTPAARRSLCYGFSFAMGLGLGSFGAGFAGLFQSDAIVYSGLALVATLGGIVCLAICGLNRSNRGGPP